MKLRLGVATISCLLLATSAMARPGKPSRSKAVRASASASASLRGTVRERGTRKPLADVTVYLKGTAREALTDAKGRFAFRKLRAGRHHVLIPTIGHEIFERVIQLSLGERWTLSCDLEPKVYGGLEVVVRDKRLGTEVTQQVIGKRELTLIAGGQGDAVRAVENMPGVLRGSDFNGVAIRGSGPEDSAIMLDGHRIPLLFHFGGFKAVYNSELLSEVNLLTGGHGVRWGDATGGVVELRTRAPRMDRWGGYLDASLIDASAMAEGPLSRDLGVAVAFRRSTIDALLAGMKSGEDFQFTALPVYYDYQGKLHYRPSRRHTFRLDSYGSFDNMSLTSNIVDDRDPEFSGGFDMTLMFHSVIARHRYRGSALDLETSLGYAHIDSSWGVGQQSVSSLAHTLTWRQDGRYRFSDTHALLFGGQLRAEWIGFEGDIARPPKEGEPTWTSADRERLQFDTDPEGAVIASAYLADELTLGKLTLIPGLRLDYATAIDRGTVSPNLRVKLVLHPRLTLKAAAGLYAQLPEADERITPVGARGLGFERAVHATGGAEVKLGGAMELQAQGYYKLLRSMVRRVDAGGEPYDNEAKGRAYGGELLLRHRWTKRFFGWVSYSYSRAMRNDGPGSPFRLFDMDQTHNVVALASWEFAKGWRLGARFQYTTGEPYTDIYASAYQGDSGTYAPIYDPRNKNTRRRPAFHRLDLRVDKRWVFRDWMLHAYLDVQNAYYHENPVQTAHNYDYSEQAYYKTLPILPSFGLKGQF
jgi:hypothetical protein